MAFRNFNILSCDILVIGGGGSGLRAAIEAKERGADVTIVSKSRVGFGNNTFISKGTFAVATGLGDSSDNPDVHTEDSIIGGRFINDQRLVKVVTQESGDQIAFLEKCGVKFFKRQGKISLMHTPGHSFSRHVRGEHQTGRDFTLPLREYAHRIGVRFAERIFITKVFISKNRIAAATGITYDGSFLTFFTTCVILATGGFAQVYLHNNNAAGMTGDGHALAYALGIPLKDMEFIQFYPTALGPLGSRLFLYEAFILQAGAVLRNDRGDDIIAKYSLNDPMVMTRDRLTRAIMHEILESRDVDGGALIDLSSVPDEKLNRLLHLLPSVKLSKKSKFVVSPTAHFCMGGIIIDESAETSVPGLFAAGEVCAGIHGANRLGGNALTEVFTIGGIAGRMAAIKAGEIGRPDFPTTQVAEEKTRLESLLTLGNRDARWLRKDLKQLMWDKAGIIREKSGLQEAVRSIKELTADLPRVQIRDGRGLIKYLELCNMLLLSEMVCRAALLRTESRGAHYRTDYPDENNKNWLKNILIHKKDSDISLDAVKVSMGPVIP
jgi:fumarate reductase (CoM/CoB) subunit A